jgi:hypothetical protein
MAKVFRGKYIEGFKTAYYNDELQLPGQLEVFKNPRVFETWINDLVNRNWVSYCKAPFDGPGQVIEYVGRYTPGSHQQPPYPKHRRRKGHFPITGEGLAITGVFFK